MSIPAVNCFGRTVLAALAAAVLSGCASTPNILYDYDHGADFGAYKTYNFFENAGPDTGEYQSFFTRYMIAAITEEMENRGYVRSDDPDLLVNFNAVLSDKTRISSTPAMGPPMGMGGYYGYRTGYYGAWGGYGTETQVSQYTEGTLNIDIVDARRKQLVWEAVGVGRVTDDTRENLEQKVREGVPKFFAGYPFVAGSSLPVTPQK